MTSSTGKKSESVYSKIMNLMIETYPNLIKKEEITIIQNHYPSFGSLAQALFKGHHLYEGELILSDTTGIHPAASFAVYDYINGSKLGSPRAEMRHKFDMYNPPDKSHIQELNSYLIFCKALLPRSNVQDTNVYDDEDIDADDEKA